MEIITTENGEQYQPACPRCQSPALVDTMKGRKRLPPDRYQCPSCGHHTGAPLLCRVERLDAQTGKPILRSE